MISGADMHNGLACQRPRLRERAAAGMTGLLAALLLPVAMLELLAEAREPAHVQAMSCRSRCE